MRTLGKGMVRAPFTEQQIENIIAYQADDTKRPLTCRVHFNESLFVTSEFLKCQKCGLKFYDVPEDIANDPTKPLIETDLEAFIKSKSQKDA